ncbi:EAL domain protein [Neorickettsia helminthoeca str. Oregon]|uniref:EAL domain protein n=1 Tax=Neorickettsia helminthoeca str. Oregon TaxID=1286528 RepID=X5GWB7_9RICK|nr:EAL domain-containing protein [Neorickettsia helminthoeca]AHX11362.1 EAL domain protein [Neorickettsia helminthoeca str. Oregon]
MLLSCNYFIKRKILALKSGVLVVVRIMNPLSYKIFSDGKRKYEKELSELERQIRTLKLDIVKYDSENFLLLIDDEGAIEGIHAKVTELASSVFLEYVAILLGYYVFLSEAPDEVIRKAFTAASFGERHSKPLVNYLDCEPQLQCFCDAIRKSTVLYNALRNSNLYGVFQPIVDIQNSEVVFNEFLLRIKGQETIQDYITAAEKTNLISIIDEFVFKHVMTLLESNPDLKLSFNISMFSINNGRWVDDILRLFVNLPFIAKRVVVEITEEMMLRNLDKVFDFIFKLKSVGCSIALDDFGRNFYIPFLQLEKLPIDYIKLDKEFAKGITDSKNVPIFMSSILEIAKNLNVKIIAEFVEDSDVFKAFKQLGIRYMQGNYLQKASTEVKDTIIT